VQLDTVDCPEIDTKDLSISSFNMGHHPGEKVAANDNSLAMAQPKLWAWL